MGTFTRRLGQLAGKSLTTESAAILRDSASNKVPGSLSLALDATLKQGHDMRVFGLGTAATLSNRARYARFTRNMLAVYSRMERHLDLASSSAPSSQHPPVALVWNAFSSTLRRAPSLHADLIDVGVVLSSDELSALSGGSSVGDCSGVSPATVAYLSALDAAAADDANTGGARLLGHLYCRYFADLFGGQMLRAPTAYALGLPSGTPRHYNFDFRSFDYSQTLSVGNFVGDGGNRDRLSKGALQPPSRKEFIESLYRQLNEAGKAPYLTTPEEQKAVAAEALLAFELNVGVYAEEGRLYADAVKGTANVAAGFTKAYFFSK
mmetsp:Transcript_55501/g.111316  ORF Transcript_55501/g.111316 Transcript_55501/m.111316 type:complete len:322 (-) Transcript_55501:139-1104(-)